MKRKHADLAMEYFSDDSVEIQYEYSLGEWRDIDYPTFNGSTNYRRKPKTIKYRVALMSYRDDKEKTYIDIEQFGGLRRLSILSFFNRYLTDWIEIEI